MARYIIVGTGVAGISAATAIRTRDSQSEIVMIGDEPQGYYSRPGLAYYLSNEVAESLLYPYKDADYHNLKLRWVHGQVTRIDPAAHRLEVNSGSPVSMTYDRLLLATGARASRIKVSGSDLTGVVKLDNFADAQQILALARKAKSAVVVGGGITALELVEGLRARGLRVAYFLRGDRYWSNVLDETESKIVEQRLVGEGVKIYPHTELGEIMGKNGKVCGVVTRDGRQIACEMVAIAIGIEARIELAAAAGLRVERGILVDEFMRTSDPEIYAAGDVAQVYDPLSRKYMIDSLWTPARQQGWAAGLNLSGGEVPYRKEAVFNVTRLAGITTTIIGMVGSGPDLDLVGIARGDSETWRQLPDALAVQSGFDVNHVRILVGHHTLLGAVIMGDQTLSQPLEQLVLAQADVTAIRDRLLRPGEKPGDVVIDFWTHWRQAHAAR